MIDEELSVDVAVLDSDLISSSFLAQLVIVEMIINDSNNFFIFDLILIFMIQKTKTVCHEEKFKKENIGEFRKI